MQLIILTGMSGAGKTPGLEKVRDSGYFCVDNLPCEMCVGLVELCKRATPPVEKAAVVMDSRERIFRLNMKNTLGRLDEAGVDYRIVFLDCRDEILERRYNETRRRHPLSDDIAAGIRMEREMLAELRIGQRNNRHYQYAPSGAGYGAGTRAEYGQHWLYDKIDELWL